MGSLIGVSLLGGIGGAGGGALQHTPATATLYRYMLRFRKKECDPSKCSKYIWCGPFKLCYCVAQLTHLFLTVRITSI